MDAEASCGDRLALFGGVYNNYLALEATLGDARSHADEVFCLGDLGAFGPFPDRSIEILKDAGIPIVQGNYDHSVGNRRDDCACGYTDPRDNHFALLSYQYTFENTSERHTEFLASLPRQIRLRDGRDRSILLAHGSPRRQNEFLWESTSSTPFLERLLDEGECDILVVTHTGIPWKRHLPSGRLVVNVGAIGRPANDGRTEVWYAILKLGGDTADAEFRTVGYDYEHLARDMEREDLPTPFIETIRTGWWTTCLEILPARERARGKF